MSGEVAVLTSALLVVTAFLPRVPSYISQHLPDLFDLFVTLATIRETTRLGMSPALVPTSRHTFPLLFQATHRKPSTCTWMWLSTTSSSSSMLSFHAACAATSKLATDPQQRRKTSTTTLL